MNFSVIQMTKFKAWALKGLQKHDEISVNSIRLLVAPNGLKEGIMNRVRAIRENSGETKKLRKDAVVAVGLLITSDAEAFERMGKEKTHAFFVDSLRFIQNRYGDANVVSATVHIDEKTPHMHAYFAPEFEGKLSAKNLFAPKRKELTHLHTDFAKQVGEKYGLKRGIEGSLAKHISSERFNAEKLKNAHEAVEKVIIESFEARKIENNEEYMKFRCCMCPNGYGGHSSCTVCPGVANTLHPHESPCRFVKKYEDPITKSRYKVAFNDVSLRYVILCKPNDLKDRTESCIQTFTRFDDAQSELNQLAARGCWKSIKTY